MPAFRLTLALHAPVILPVVPPRLETLLQEGLRRLHQDWDTVHDLPLVFDRNIQGYRNSQLIFATTAKHGLIAQRINLTSRPLQGDLHLTQEIANRSIKKPYMIKLDGGPNAPRLTRHDAIRAPYAVFYADGDPEETLRCLQTIRAVGKEHKRYFGAFTVMGIERVTNERWALRSWPAGAANDAAATIDSPWIPDTQCLSIGQPEVAVVRPPRVIREPFHA
tara:strand:- start:211 stop:873 length:663 start_codon:yes stop_codon:yes gene_type:complete